MFGKLLTAIATPFNHDTSVNYGLFEKLAAYLIENGSEGLVVHGTTGESPTLTHEEEFALYRSAVKAVGEKAAIIAGVGSNSTATTIECAEEAEKIGVDGALVVVPYYNKPSQEGMYQHFKAVAESTSLPIIIYNIPGRCVVNMLPETAARLSKIKNIVGLKDSAANPEQTKKTKALVPDSFTIWSGDDGMTLDFMKEGAVGVISVASHLVGPRIKEMIDAYDAKNLQTAEMINEELQDLFNVLFITANPTPLKAAMEMIGWKVGIPRLPLVEANDAEKAQIRTVLKKHGLVK